MVFVFKGSCRSRLDTVVGSLRFTVFVSATVLITSDIMFWGVSVSLLDDPTGTFDAKVRAQSGSFCNVILAVAPHTMLHITIYIHTYIHIYIHTYIHMYIYIYI